MKTLSYAAILAAICVAAVSAEEAAEEAAEQSADITSTDWRDDTASLEAVRLLNQAYPRMPFSREFEGVLDDCPVRLDWTVGPNVPVAWKGGVAGVIDGQIILSGGLWMPQRANLTYAYDIAERTYEALPPPPVRPQYTQGVCDGRALYVVGGRGAGRRVLKLARQDGEWRWTDMPSLPEAEGAGRWLAAAGIDPGKWLFLVAGHPTGTPSEVRDKPQLPDYRLRLDRPNARWERMAAYPGGHRALVQSVVVDGKLYAFGGSHPDPTMRTLYLKLSREYGVRVPYNGVPNYRDAYRYDPASDTWTPLRRVPFPIFAGHAVAIDARHILLMGSADIPTHRVSGADSPSRWTGYGDRILCYDIQQDNYYHVGVMAYGVATSHWVYDGTRLYSFGGEPAHGVNMNTENVLQIGTVEFPAKENGR